MAARSGRSATARGGVARQLLDAPGGDLQPEVLGGHLLERVGLVEDHHVVAGQHLGPGGAGAHAEVGHVEVVVDQHQLRPRRPGPGPG